MPEGTGTVLETAGNGRGRQSVTVDGELAGDAPTEKGACGVTVRLPTPPDRKAREWSEAASQPGEPRPSRMTAGNDPLSRLSSLSPPPGAPRQRSEC
jgi:hypothetical protein